MRILFLTMNVFTDIEMHNIYSDLMKEFIKYGHKPYIVTPREKKMGERTELIDFDTYSILKVQIGNMSGASLFEKGISTMDLSRRFYNAILKKIGTISFGLILYSTPPITIAASVKKLKKHFQCKTYLMLKDIFPQNAIDLEMFSKNSVFDRYFRTVEKQLYQVSDYIGCMSPANIRYLLKNNPWISRGIVEECPNAIIPNALIGKEDSRAKIRERYGIDADVTCFLYGGNLGKPQGIEFLIRCLDAARNSDAHYIICGSGSEYELLQNYINTQKPNNVTIINGLPKEQYDELVSACDVGLIFLDYRFTIPNFPSRLLSYMEYELPVLACTDRATDIGKIIEENQFGWWCASNDVEGFVNLCEKIQKIENLKEIGEQGFEILQKKYYAERCYRIIINHFK